MIKNKKLSFVNGLIFFCIGLMIFLNPESIVKFVSYCLGGSLIAIGIYRTLNYYIQDKRLGVVNRNELAFGITAIVLGVVFIFLADAIELLLRFIVGGWLVIAGLNKISKTFYTTERNSKFYSLIVVGLILVAIGLYIIVVSNLALSILGLFMMLYGLIDFVSYFVYKEKEEIIEENILISKKTKIEETDYEEVEFEEKVDDTENKKNKKKKTSKKK